MRHCEGAAEVVGSIYNLLMNNRADYRKSWYQQRTWEPGLYEKFHVKNWKGRMPIYDPDLFDPRKYSWDEIAQAMCQSELVHETIVVFSFLPIFTSVWFGSNGVFIIGKTFLVDETFAGRITFRHAGLSPADEDSKGLLKAQLNHFYNSLILHGMEERKEPDNWLDAFLLLEQFLMKIDDGSRQLVFLDELPWLGITDGGRLSKNLNALIASDFITKYVPFGLSKREEHYKLIDPFCLFYLHFVQDQTKTNEKFWQQNVMSQPVVVWRGFAFENVCFNHIDQIKHALGISGIISSSSAWSKKGGDEEGVQIDLLIQRNDNVINMCEIKFTSEDFIVDKNYYRVLLSRPERIRELVSSKISVQNTLITTYGLKCNEYSGAFANVITMEDLFL